MTGFSNKAEMITEWTREAAHAMFHQGSQPSYVEALEIASIMARNVAVYVPHIYRGGWVIRGFGFSSERIGVFTSMETAGDPLAV